MLKSVLPILERIFATTFSNRFKLLAKCSEGRKEGDHSYGSLALFIGILDGDHVKDHHTTSKLLSFDLLVLLDYVS